MKKSRKPFLPASSSPLLGLDAWQPHHTHPHQYNIKQIFIHPDSIYSKLVVNVVSAFPNVPVIVKESVVWDENKPDQEKGNILFLLPLTGAFLKPCPCTPAYIGCEYITLNLVSQCNLGCSYCILQSYLKDQTIRIFTNTERATYEIDRFLLSNTTECFRFGTGEMSDSLIFDEITGTGANLIQFFSQKKNAILELKTKTANVLHLLDQNHRGRTILAWSLNPPEFSEKEEKGCASPKDRLLAAKKCVEKGFPVAFHFDPIIHFDGWKKCYQNLVEELFEYIPSSAIAWISLGALRFMPNLKEFAEGKQSQSRFFYDEFIVGMDGKHRYPLDMRINLFQCLVSTIRHRAHEFPMYFCMESKDVWKEVLGWVPQDSTDLRHHVTQKFHSNKFD